MNLDFLLIFRSNAGEFLDQILDEIFSFSYSPFCVPAKVIKLVGLKNGGRVSPTNLITFAGTQNGE
jgi:hypothetical protein